MTTFFSFIASPAGRAARIVAGLGLVVVGLGWLRNISGWMLAIVGLVPLLAGGLDRCVLAPLFGLPFVGSHLRRAIEA
jgi:hypothetical protein